MKKTCVFASVLCIMLCGCSKNDSPTGNSAKTALNISSASLNLFMTRGTDAEDLKTEGAAIGLFCNATTGYEARNNAKYVYSGSGSPQWKGEAESDIIYLNDNNAQLAAYYPYESEHSLTTFTLFAQEANAAADLCYRKYNDLSSDPPLNNTSNTVSLLLSHAYAKITFKITRDVSYSSTCKISAIKIEDGTNAGTKLIPASALNIEDGSYSNDAAGSVSCGITTIDAIPNVFVPGEASVFMIPVAVLDDTTIFTFTVDGHEMSTTFATDEESSLHELAAGTNYILNVTVKGEALGITSVSVSDWNDSPIAGTLEPKI